MEPASEARMALPKTPALTTDCVIFDADGRVLLIRRGHEPFAGSHALPGGFVELGETVEAACRREVLEEVNVKVSELTLVGVYSDPKRDPRGHTVSIAYATILPGTVSVTAGSDAAGVEWIKDWQGLILAFDHAQILADAVAMLKQKLERCRAST
jgi:8-oxo-dGTP diphosphatase